MNQFFGKFQKLGKALMLPIAVLPIAGLLLRLGQADLLNIEFIQQAGAAVFDNLALIFAIGVAVGLAQDNNGAAGLAGAIGYLILNNTTIAINPANNLSTLGGIIAGIIGGIVYNKYKDIKLPDFLGFFAGKRFVPIMTGLITLVLGVTFGYVWPFVQGAIDKFGYWAANGAGIGEFIYGTLNRLLIPTGLHHVMNNIFWFNLGEFNGATGDLNRFFAQNPAAGLVDPTAGVYMAGLFPIMMFGLPAAAAAMYVCAKKDRKAEVGGLLLSVALTAFLTGITEPIEFMFMFLAPALFAIHAVLTGLSMAVTSLLGIRHGFTFSAGMIDYVLNMGLATKGWMIIPLGLAVAGIYFVLFVFVIKKFDLKTPGREVEDGPVVGTKGGGSSDLQTLAIGYIEALGGKVNLVDIDCCITRLRLTLADSTNVDEKAIKALGAAGIMRPNNKNLQVVIGTKAEALASEMKQVLANGLVGTSAQSTPVAKTETIVKEVVPPQAATQTTSQATLELYAPITGAIKDLSETPDAVFAGKLLGDGIAMEPHEGLVVAPCDGKVAQIFPTNHAVGIETEQGIDLLIHVGIDTVELKGEGFKRLVEEGQMVKKGDHMLRVDLESIKAAGKSTMTPFIITNTDDVEIEFLPQQEGQAGKTPVAKVRKK